SAPPRFRLGLGYYLGQFPSIAQANIETLACHWMHGLCGVAYNDQMRRGNRVQIGQLEWKAHAFADLQKTSNAVAKISMQACQEGIVRQAQQVSNFFFFPCPHQREIACPVRQQRQWSCGSEALISNIAMREF